MDIASNSEGTLSNFLECKGDGEEMYFLTCMILLMYKGELVHLVLLPVWTALQD